MEEFERRFAVILFADIVGSSEISNEHSIEHYAKILYQFYFSAHLAYQATENFNLYENNVDYFFNPLGDEICLFLLLKDTEDLKTPDCEDKIKAALRFSLALKFFWYLSEFNLHRMSNQLAPREIGIGIHVGPISLQKKPPELLGSVQSLALQGYSINLAKRVEQSSHSAPETRIFISSETNALIDGFRECRDLLQAVGLEPARAPFDPKNISTYNQAYELRRIKTEETKPIRFFDELAGKEELLEKNSEVLERIRIGQKTDSLAARIKSVRERHFLYPDNFWINRISGVSARQKFEKFYTDDPGFTRARIYFEDGEYEKAAKFFSELKQDPRFMQNKDAAFEIHFCLGDSLAQVGSNQSAIEEYESASKLYPAHSGLLNNWGVALGRIGRHDEAISKYEEANKLKPNDPDTLLNWGAALVDVGRPEEAISKFEQADNLRPNAPEILVSWANVLFDLEKDAEAIAKFKEADKRRPYDPDTLLNWGNALDELGRHEEAIAKYEQADKIRPNHPNILINWGNALIGLEKNEEAIAKFEQADKIRPNHPNTLLNWGVALSHAGRREEAIQKYRQVDKLRPNHPATLMNWGVTLIGAGKLEEALPKLKEAHELAPHDMNILNNLIQCLHSLGRDKEAAILEKLRVMS